MKPPLASFLLVFLYLLEAAGAIRKIACLEGFGPLKLLNGGQWKMLHFNWHSGHAPVDCSFDSVSKICRKAFPDVAYGKRDGSIDVHYSKVHRISDRYHRTTKWKNGALEFQEFSCQEYVRASEPVGNNETWSDKFVATKHSVCRSEESWIEMVEEKCGEKPAEHHLGGSCGDTKTFLEIAYICHQPLDDPKNTFLEIMEDIFSEYVQKISALLASELTKVRDEKTSEDDFRSLKRRGEAARRIGLVSALDEEHDLTIFWSDETADIFISRLTSEIAAKHRLLQHGFKRASMLFKMVADLIYNKATDHNYLLKFYGFYSQNHVDELIGAEVKSHFAELETGLKEYWTSEICKKNTPLLLEEYRSAKKCLEFEDLLQMYVRIVGAQKETSEEVEDSSVNDI
ncbi:hypothetical protein L596_007607 [Steinernema carpocapsae]|nr:hypothetical protein L596_007607 [Steinernema carpocapsae]